MRYPWGSCLPSRVMLALQSLPRRTCLGALAALSLVALGCDAPAAGSHTETSPVPQLHLVTRISSTDSVPFNAVDVGVGRGTRILILDSDNWRIVMFNSAGHLLDRFGGKGSGPGEIRLAKDLRYRISGADRLRPVVSCRALRASCPPDHELRQRFGTRLRHAPSPHYCRRRGWARQGSGRRT